MADFLEHYSRASEWTVGKIAGAADQLDTATPCEEWSVRTLLNHMLETQRYFVSVAAGAPLKPPSPTPPELISDDPVTDFTQVRTEILEAFGQPGVIEKTGPSLGIATSDLTIHGWDLAKATGQDATMPDDLPDAIYQLINGFLTDEQRKGLFKPAVAVPGDATPQQRLLAYTGRNPD